MHTDWKSMVALLRGTSYRHPIRFERGLSDREVRAAEERFHFYFPPDLRELLQTALPFGNGFPDWRFGAAVSLEDWLDTPRQGVLFDVEHNDFWLEEWGERPADIAAALSIASDAVLRCRARSA